jgi:tRNA-Thr(GGU) m(6)t(6)A37 methyltransferase TsaA
MMFITYTPIGIIHSPYTDPVGMPIQPTGARGIAGTVDVFPEYCAGLKDLDGFSHVILLYHFHCSKGYALEIKPFMDDERHGLFATRAPRRPNPIGLSVVRLVGVEDCTLRIEDVDILDGTPLLDIKPYVPEFDSREAERTGWLASRASTARDKKSDARFSSPDS